MNFHNEFLLIYQSNSLFYDFFQNMSLKCQKMNHKKVKNSIMSLPETFFEKVAENKPPLKFY